MWLPKKKRQTAYSKTVSLQWWHCRPIEGNTPLVASSSPWIWDFSLAVGKTHLWETQPHASRKFWAPWEWRGTLPAQIIAPGTWITTYVPKSRHSVEETHVTFSRIFIWFGSFRESSFLLPSCYFFFSLLLLSEGTLIIFTSNMLTFPTHPSP